MNTPAKRKLIIILLVLMTLGCLVGAYVFAGISTMFGGSVSSHVGWTYYLWFEVPLALWICFFGFLALGLARTHK